MRALAVSLFAAVAASAGAAEVARVPPWEFHSSFWMSLHETLIAEAMRKEPHGLPDLAPGERSAWTDAVNAYRAAGGSGDMTFADPMVITSDGLTQVADDAADPAIDAPLAEALRRAAPAYRTHGWEADDRANRFFIAYAAALLREGGEELIRGHEAAYCTRWPRLVRVYLSPAAGPFGAYTITGRSGGVITTMSSRDPGYQGLRALEMLLHESSHAVVGPNRGSVAEAIAAAAKRRGIAPPGNLWHAILFFTSGELTKRFLESRGVPDYRPSSDDLFTRAWPQYRTPIEQHWIPHLAGRGTLEDAIDAIVGAVAR